MPFGGVGYSWKFTVGEKGLLFSYLLKYLLLKSKLRFLNVWFLPDLYRWIVICNHDVGAREHELGKRFK